ncbi:glyoxalase superfamily protein [Streptomyces sp. NBC_00280]|uniref:glyoxalase superfamily protein n=1 Tax=Streptomyces sp. NBC_00280 TaxID=2975699 RepID=UPI00352D0FEF
MGFARTGSTASSPGCHSTAWSGSRVRDVFALHKELLAQSNAPVRPGIDPDASGGPTLKVIDPYGNILRFTQPPSAQ